MHGVNSNNYNIMYKLFDSLKYVDIHTIVFCIAFEDDPNKIVL